jgi:hypothetical protein
MTKSLALDPHDPSLVEIYYHHAPAFRRVSLRLFGIGISLVYCLIHLHSVWLIRLIDLSEQGRNFYTLEKATGTAEPCIVMHRSDPGITFSVAQQPGQQHAGCGRPRAHEGIYAAAA